MEQEMATHSSILSWRAPWTEEPGGLQSMGSQRVGYDLVTEHEVSKRRRLIKSIKVHLLLLLLSRFSRVQLCATPQTAAHQAPPSMGFSRQEHWSGLHFLLQCRKVKSESEVTQSCPTPSDPMDCSPPGPSVHGIVQARVLEWVDIAFSNNPAIAPQMLKPEFQRKIHGHMMKI